MNQSILSLRRVPVSRWASSFHTSLAQNKVLTMKNMNENVLHVQYAVRGPIVIKAGQLEKELKEGAKKSYDQVIRANIGDCHATGQKPISFLRNVMACTILPELMNDAKFASDVKDRVKRILDGCGGRSVGAYTDSAGVEVIRRDIAKFLEARDGGVPCNYEDIFLTTGASGGIKTMMELLLTKATSTKPAGFMIPIPQYPLYSATISEFNATKVGYYLNEENKWSMDVTELERAFTEASATCDIRAICIINPGNPTGQVLSKKNIEDVIRWAHKKNVFILADEVYQDNIYAEGMKFHSFKKVAYELGAPYKDMEIASFYSVSKGYMGECGARAGFMEVVNMDAEVKAQFQKLISVSLRSSVVGQACMAAVVNPPKEGEPSFKQFNEEKNEVLDGLKQKAQLVTKLFNSIEGVSCQPVQGAMYAFPNIKIPQRAIEKAKNLNMEPDAFYCFQLLEQTGICVVPGSGFHQRAGTYHFRTTILPPIEQIETLLENFKKFHLGFLKQWK